jgi:catechol 2,3-dioxygenase-like lactoylglutathione lyase family enzyme
MLPLCQTGGDGGMLHPPTAVRRYAASHLNMTESAPERVAHHWYLRPVLFVSDLQAALLFYLDKLGFEKRWHAGDGKGTVCQVNRGGCEIILCEDAARQDRGRLFVELNRDGMDELRREISERSVPIQKGWWGYDVIRIADPDGNELLFPLDDTNDSTRPT